MLITVAVITCLAVAYLTYKSEAQTLLKLVVLPLFFALSLLTYDLYISMLGAPIEGKPVGEFEYIHHNSDGETTHLWASIEGQHRLHYFPYNREEEQKLQESKKAKEAGASVKGEFKSQRSGLEQTEADTLTVRFERPSPIRKN